MTLCVVNLSKKHRGRIGVNLMQTALGVEVHSMDEFPLLQTRQTLQCGDFIRRINGVRVSSAEEAARRIRNSVSLSMCVERND